MRYIFVAAILGVFLALLYLARRRMTLPNGPAAETGTTSGEGEIHSDALPDLITAMRASTHDLRYATLILLSRGDSYDGVNLQISVQAGRMGFDWALTTPQNIEHEWAFSAFARTQGLTPLKQTMNGVDYLRVEPVDTAAFTARVIHDLCGYPRDMDMNLVFEGFVWDPE